MMIVSSASQQRAQRLPLDARLAVAAERLPAGRGSGLRSCACSAREAASTTLTSSNR
jgi:hypothetical protein